MENNTIFDIAFLSTSITVILLVWFRSNAFVEYLEFLRLDMAFDVKGYKKQFKPFEIFGTNSIFLFLLSGLWTKTIISIKLNLDDKLVSSYHYLYKTIFLPLAGEYNGSLLFSISHLIVFWFILYWMDQKKIQIKL